MAKKLTCDHCGADVIVNGEQVRPYYEYDTLPFPIAHPTEHAVVCAPCDAMLRHQGRVRSRGAQGRA